MTLRMADDIYASNLPAGYDAYLGYVDGQWPDSAAEAARFTTVPIVSLAVFAADTKSIGVDIENGDLTPAQAPPAIEARLSAGVWRPVCYASISAMPDVISALTSVGIQRNQVRLLSAHYGMGAHICGPTAISGQPCYPGATQMDGTQWTSSAPGLNGSLIDESLLTDDFFSGSPVSPNPQPVPVPVPPARRNTYTPVTVDGVFGARTCAAQQFVDFDGDTSQCDGVFGPLSKKAMQAHLGVTQDGIIGPVTVRALQAKVGATQDGLWGPVTSASLQHCLNLGTY